MKRTIKLPWDEEHVEAMTKVEGLALGEKWRFGIYQVIRDKELPQTKFKDNNLTEFLIPDEFVSLKLFFDNFRNYAICAAFIALGSILWLNSASLFPKEFPSFLATTCACVIWLMAGLLLILNFMQTWILLRETHDSIRAIQISEVVIYRPSLFVFRFLALLHGILSWLLGIGVNLLVFLFQMSVMLIMFGFVYYAVVSTPGVK
ncbi:MAG: hypothetical protein JNM42_08180 [Propionivibrio sp.]|uniref:hypothetical protein n=1 Tax=Propionivibrio sp. TaxID=2212460 RepID=UPI001A4078FA|nr:hypothetical protein [Propionivibrio sp.]MBL8414400.1 hypothetical protein [Propionivibrio sp.]